MTHKVEVMPTASVLGSSTGSSDVILLGKVHGQDITSVGSLLHMQTMFIILESFSSCCIKTHLPGLHWILSAQWNCLKRMSVPPSPKLMSSTGSHWSRSIAQTKVDIVPPSLPSPYLPFFSPHKYFCIYMYQTTPPQYNSYTCYFKGQCRTVTG